jgi:hypothetical protein
MQIARSSLFCNHREHSLCIYPFVDAPKTFYIAKLLERMAIILYYTMLHREDMY